MSAIKNKKIAFKILLTIGYILLCSSYVYSIYYSMPANDDFAWAIEWWSKNRIVEMFHRIAWNYTNSFGNSGIFAIAVQILFNPLYHFENTGHSFGISMIIVNVLILVGILLAVRSIFKYLFAISEDIVLDILTFLVACLLTTSYYYSDVYNWWSGTPGYSGMMMMLLITCASILKYQNTLAKKHYIIMIIVGVITCTSMMYCVAVGAFYVLTTFVIEYKNGDSLRCKILPLIGYIISGVLMVIAPGNYSRMGNEESADASLLGSIEVAGYRILNRFITSIQTKPWIPILMIVILLLGIFIGSKRKQNLLIILFGIICNFVAAFSGVLLYVYGSNKTFDSEFTPRIYYVEDYMMFVGMALTVFAIGAFINQTFKMNIASSAKIAVTALFLLCSGAYLISGNRFAGIIQVDIYAHKELIRESWLFWDEILNVVEQADDGAELVIDRDNVDWCQYSYYVGLDEIPRETLKADARYGNCNQCASKYYGVNSIVVNLY